MIALKFNQRLKKLGQQKESGDLQFERAKGKLREFYEQIRKKIDEHETKSFNEIRGSIFIRS